MESRRQPPPHPQKLERDVETLLVFYEATEPEFSTKEKVNKVISRFKKKAKKKAAKRASRAKSVADVRMKLFWGVFNQSLKRVALYDFSQKKQAEKKATELSKSGKSPHFVQKVKEVIEE